MLWSSGWVNLTTPPGVKTTGLHGIGLTVTHTHVSRARMLEHTHTHTYTHTHTRARMLEHTRTHACLPQDTKEEYKNLVDAFGVVEQKKP